MIKTYNDFVEINESVFSKTMLSMRGLSPSIKTIGIITAFNPNGIEQSIKDNKIANSNLEKDLKSANFGFRKVDGEYGNLEKSFIIPNINKQEILDLGEKYKQETIIFGEQIEDGFKFDMIYTDENIGQIKATRSVFNIGDFDNYYTEIKGRKFNIPFFDDEYANATWKPEHGVIDKNLLNQEALDFLDCLQNKLFEENRTSKSLWINRGFIKNTLFYEYKKVQENVE